MTLRLTAIALVAALLSGCGKDWWIPLIFAEKHPHEQPIKKPPAQEQPHG